MILSKRRAVETLEASRFGMRAVTPPIISIICAAENPWQQAAPANDPARSFAQRLPSVSPVFASL